MPIIEVFYFACWYTSAIKRPCALVAGERSEITPLPSSEKRQSQVTPIPLSHSEILRIQFERTVFPQSRNGGCFAADRENTRRIHRFLPGMGRCTTHFRRDDRFISAGCFMTIAESGVNEDYVYWYTYGLWQMKSTLSPTVHQPTDNSLVCRRACKAYDSVPYLKGHAVSTFCSKYLLKLSGGTHWKQ